MEYCSGVHVNVLVNVHVLELATFHAATRTLDVCSVTKSLMCAE